MKIIHTADLHLGQIIYQNYDRADEHACFFGQLERLCAGERPDALVVCGDVFDVPQPSAAVRRDFVDRFVELHHSCPSMKIVITAGNHDSPSRLQADSRLWELANACVVGVPPAAGVEHGGDDGWMEPYIVRLDAGYIIAMPYIASERHGMLQALLDAVDAENTGGLPVVMTAHAAVAGLNPAGHDFEIGTLRTIPLSAFGRGYDYLALGHIHMPQTLGAAADVAPAPVARYAGSALHVSCDEAYPHSVSVVDIDRHGGTVAVRCERIRQLRHFHTLPASGSFASADEALQAVGEALEGGTEGYLRLRIDYGAALPSDFTQRIYDMIAGHEHRLRYNPKVLWTGRMPAAVADGEERLFEIAELQQMTDPMLFVERTIGQYAGLTLEELREAFAEVEQEVARMRDNDKKPKGRK